MLIVKQFVVGVMLITKVGSRVMLIVKQRDVRVMRTVKKGCDGEGGNADI